MARKILPLFSLSIVLIFTGCGGNSASTRAANNLPPTASASTPSPTPSPFPSPTPVLAPTPTPVDQDAVPIVCTNTLPTDPNGQICDQNTPQSPVFYEHWQWLVADRGDGHGTFSIATETGIRVGSTYKIIVDFPHPVVISEVHGTLNILSFCQANGFATFWQGAQAGGPLEQLVAAKTATLNINDEPNFVIPQVIFPQGVPVSKLLLFVNNDLCASSTVSWTLNGSY